MTLWLAEIADHLLCERLRFAVLCCDKSDANMDADRLPLEVFAPLLIAAYSERKPNRQVSTMSNSLSLASEGKYAPGCSFESRWEDHSG